MSKETKHYYDNEELELTVGGIDYSVNVHATGTRWYSPATRIDPEENDFNLDNVEATWYVENGKVEETKEMHDALEEYLLNDAEWEEEEPPEPDYDYYEERAMARWEAQLDRMGL